MRGFTLLEVIITVGIVSLLIGFTVVNVIGFQDKANLNSILVSIIADTKEQQLKAMVGDTEGRATAARYGVHFDTSPNRYVLFHGQSYDANNATNFPVNLPQTLSFSSIAFPGGNVIFSQGDGAVAGFVAGSNTVTISNSASGETRTISVNRYGVITQIN